MVLSFHFHYIQSTTLLVYFFVLAHYKNYKKRYFLFRVLTLYSYTHARTLVPYHRILPSDILGVFGSGMINRTFRILYIIRIIRTSNADFF